MQNTGNDVLSTNNSAVLLVYTVPEFWYYSCLWAIMMRFYAIIVNNFKLWFEITHRGLQFRSDFLGNSMRNLQSEDDWNSSEKFSLKATETRGLNSKYFFFEVG